MSLILNILWLICGGLIVGIVYMVGGLLLCLTIIGIPFGLQCIKLGAATMTPFGKQLVESPHAYSPLSTVFNIIWVIFFGIPIALAHITHAIPLFISIIGIPFGIQHIKLVPLALFPFGRDLV
ncbi:putative membrane protein [Synechococcus sp. PCC 7502]|uniref:YccF domain-containing protein n=1 Tax=Synechococcus sp. PCC 7502 TaxID=1173263 RepID=UPI00029FF88D|nr:YccF domain-containing protein [Synechococcus sp. PCC 7502]AFY73685.1 putative membrane protein [Synechococcus sp. PCC 7502]